jgi:hypothetical protein
MSWHDLTAEISDDFAALGSDPDPQWRQALHHVDLLARRRARRRLKPSPSDAPGTRARRTDRWKAARAHKAARRQHAAAQARARSPWR